MLYLTLGQCCHIFSSLQQPKHLGKCYLRTLHLCLDSVPWNSRRAAEDFCCCLHKLSHYTAVLDGGDSPSAVAAIHPEAVNTIVISYTVFLRHQQGIYVLEALELWLVDLVYHFPATRQSEWTYHEKHKGTKSNKFYHRTTLKSIKYISSNILTSQMFFNEQWFVYYNLTVICSVECFALNSMLNSTVAIHTQIKVK